MGRCGIFWEVVQLELKGLWDPRGGCSWRQGAASRAGSGRRQERAGISWESGESRTGHGLWWGRGMCWKCGAGKHKFKVPVGEQLMNMVGGCECCGSCYLKIKKCCSFLLFSVLTPYPPFCCFFLFCLSFHITYYSEAPQSNLPQS